MQICTFMNMLNASSYVAKTDGQNDNSGMSEEIFPEFKAANRDVQCTRLNCSFNTQTLVGVMIITEAIQTITLLGTITELISQNVTKNNTQPRYVGLLKH